MNTRKIIDRRLLILALLAFVTGNAFAATAKQYQSLVDSVIQSASICSTTTAGSTAIRRKRCVFTRASARWAFPRRTWG